MTDFCAAASIRSLQQLDWKTEMACMIYTRMLCSTQSICSRHTHDGNLSMTKKIDQNLTSPKGYLSWILSMDEIFEFTISASSRRLNLGSQRQALTAKIPACRRYHQASWKSSPRIVSKRSRKQSRAKWSGGESGIQNNKTVFELGYCLPSSGSRNEVVLYC